jgi:uncharacterized spore protein YtfJ
VLYTWVTDAHDERKAMDIQEVVSKAQDALTARRVYGEPIELDGVVIIPAAEVSGGGGGGGGADQSGSSGEGGGYGLRARPVGAYVVQNGNVRWEPAIDVAGLVLRVGLVGVAVALLARIAGR